MNTADFKLQQYAGMVQDSCHQFAEAILKAKPNISYQDATNVFLFTKIAELQIENEKLKEAIEKL